MKAPFGSTREPNVSKVRHKSRCVGWETYAGHVMTFRGYGFCCQKFSKEIMAVENKEDLHEDSGSSYLA